MTVHLIEIQQKYLQERKKKSNSVTSSRMYTVNVTMFLQVAGKDQASTRYKVLQSTSQSWAHSELALNEVVYKKLDHFVSGFHDI